MFGKILEMYYRMNKVEIHIWKNITWGELEWKMLKLRVKNYMEQGETVKRVKLKYLKIYRVEVHMSGYRVKFPLKLAREN